MTHENSKAAKRPSRRKENVACHVGFDSGEPNVTLAR